MLPLASYFFPLFFLAISLLVIRFAPRKTLEFWLGKKYRTFSPRAALTIFIQLLVLAVAVDALATAVGMNDTQQVVDATRDLALNPLMSVPLLALSGLSEELFFRGIALPLIGPIVSSLIFALFHAGYHSGVQLLAAFFAGLVLAHAREKNQSIFPGVAGHILYNVVAIFVLNGV